MVVVVVGDVENFVGFGDCCFEVFCLCDDVVGEDVVVWLIIDVKVVGVGVVEFDWVVDCCYDVLEVFVVLVGLEGFWEFVIVVWVVVWVVVDDDVVVGCEELWVEVEGGFVLGDGVVVNV